MRMKRLLLFTLVSTVACKPPTAGERMHSILSWVGTAKMAGEAWLRHTTPDTYTRQTLELSRESIQQVSSDLLESPPPRVNTAVLDSALTRSRDQIARMAAFITAKNAPALARELDSLRANQEFLKQISSDIESGR